MEYVSAETIHNSTIRQFFGVISQSSFRPQRSPGHSIYRHNTRKPFVGSIRDRHSSRERIWKIQRIKHFCKRFATQSCRSVIQKTRLHLTRKRLSLKKIKVPAFCRPTMSQDPNKTPIFSKARVSNIMAASVVAVVLYGFIAGLAQDAGSGGVMGTLLGFASKHLFDSSQK